MKRRIVVALAGNPNSGKTTLFNNLTGARQHVGNYPGVTVERKEGHRRHGAVDLQIVDLPGTYSLTAYSAEELVARDFLVDEKPDVVVDIVDSSNLERNLYLAVQLMELGVPLVLAFNMSDEAKARGHEFDIEKLSRFFGAPIVQTVGHKGEGMEKLLDVILAASGSGKAGDRASLINYGPEIEEELAKIQAEIKGNGAKYSLRWLAVKLLEGERDLLDRVGTGELRLQIEKSASHLEKVLGEHPEIAIAERRYGFISGACQEAVRSTIEIRHNTSDRIDSIVTNRVLGIPIFLGIMYLVFQLTFTLGEPPMGWIEGFFKWGGEAAGAWWPKGSDSVLKSLLSDGIIGGVGGVIVFLPNILLLFLAIAILEDSGYMARAAFIMDRLMHKIGLHGKSFIPMLIGFGCSVPAVMATRTLENRRDRLTTMLVVPLMSCGARLPIYALIIPAFFPDAWRAPMLWVIYVTGILLAVLGAKLLRSTVLKGESVPFVMELPPYRMPTLRGVLIHMWGRGILYLKKAGTIILGISILLWAMTSFPKKETFDLDYEAELARAEGSFSQEAMKLNPLLGLPGDSDFLVQAARSAKEKSAEKTKGPGDKPRTAVAPPNERLEEFVNVIAGIRTARTDFEEAVEKGRLKENSVEYVALASRRDAELGRLRNGAPSLHEAALRHLEDVETFWERKFQIDKGQRAEELAHSIAGRIGHALEPVLRPMGFDWKIGTALIGAFAAKEVFVAQMGIVYSVGEADEESGALREQLRSTYSPLVGFCIMLFCLVSAPCMATVAVVKRESNSWKWALLQLAGLTVLAYVLTVLVFQIGTLIQAAAK